MARHYTIPLNATPEEKWCQIIEDFKPQITSIYQKLELEAVKILGSFTLNSLSNIVAASSYFGFVLHTKELTYLSQILNIVFGKLVLVQIMYELSTCCTSAVFPLANDELIHYRTMDWAIEELKHLTITIDFIDKQKKIQYSIVTWAGYIGALTAVKKGVCSISLNYRRSPDASSLLLTNIKNLIRGYWPSGYLIRFVMENENSYWDIQNYLKQANLVAPCYFIVCGVTEHQCENIVRDRTSYMSFGLNATKIFEKSNYNLRSKSPQLDYSRNSKYIVQTNIDSFPQAQKQTNILYSKERAKLAAEIISNIQEQGILAMDDIFASFNQFPIINQATIYECIMIPKTGCLKLKEI